MTNIFLSSLKDLFTKPIVWVLVFLSGLVDVFISSYLESYLLSAIDYMMSFHSYLIGLMSLIKTSPFNFLLAIIAILLYIFVYSLFLTMILNYLLNKYKNKNNSLFSGLLKIFGFSLFLIIVGIISIVLIAILKNVWIILFLLAFYVVLFLLVFLKLLFTHAYLVDENLKIKEAVEKSWRLTTNKYFTIILFFIILYIIIIIMNSLLPKLVLPLYALGPTIFYIIYLFIYTIVGSYLIILYVKFYLNNK